MCRESCRNAYNVNCRHRFLAMYDNQNCQCIIAVSCGPQVHAGTYRSSCDRDEICTDVVFVLSYFRYFCLYGGGTYSRFVKELDLNLHPCTRQPLSPPLRPPSPPETQYASILVSYALHRYYSTLESGHNKWQLMADNLPLLRQISKYLLDQSNERMGCKTLTP